MEGAYVGPHVTGADITYPVDLTRLLRACGERTGERGATEKGDEFPPPHMLRPQADEPTLARP